MTAYRILNEEGFAPTKWVQAKMCPAIFLVVPSVKHVGEKELTRDLARMVYESAGFSDSPSRHFMSRNYPHGGNPADYAHFYDDSIEAAAITNEFHGVDCIDLTSWVGKDLSSPHWHKLSDYIHEAESTDLVFMVCSDNTNLVDKLENSLVANSGVATLRVTLGQPSPEAIANWFIALTEGVFEKEIDSVVLWAKEQIACSRFVNYSIVSSMAMKTLYEFRAGRLVEDGLGDYLSNRYSAINCCGRALGF